MEINIIIYVFIGTITANKRINAIIGKIK